jgi:hypothetical protein
VDAAVSCVEWRGRLKDWVGRNKEGGSGMSMPDKTSGKPRKKATKAASDAAAVRGAAEKADRYIADQLKLMYDAVVVEPVPDRLLQLLDRLDNEEEQ